MKLLVVIVHVIVYFAELEKSPSLHSQGNAPVKLFLTGTIISVMFGIVVVVCA